MTDIHWNQRGTYESFGITNYTVASPAEAMLYRVAPVVRGVGLSLVVVGASLDAYAVATSDNPVREVARVAGGWAGAIAGAKLFGGLGAATGSVVQPGLGTVIGGFTGSIVGGAIGYWGGSSTAQRA